MSGARGASARRHRSGRTIALLGAMALSVAACAPAESGSELAGVTERLTAMQFGRPYDMPVVTLTDQEGEPFELRAEAAGKVTLLYFGYTSCPDVCPITMARVGRALSLLEPDERDRVLPVFITLDAARDPPEQVGRWVSALHPDIVGLTGEQEALDDAVHQLGFVFPEMERPAEGFYEVAHPATLFLFTPELLGRFGYPHGEVTPEQIAADVRTLLGHDWGGGSAGAAAADPASEAESADPGPARPDDEGEAPLDRTAVHARDAFAIDPLGQDRLAVYATIVNPGSTHDTLTAISSPAAREGSLHRMAAEDGVMRMHRVGGIAVGPGETVRLEPGELHGMLEGLSRALSTGDTLEVTFRLARGAALTLRVPVRHPADVGTR